MEELMKKSLPVYITRRFLKNGSKFNPLLKKIVGQEKQVILTFVQS